MIEDMQIGDAFGTTILSCFEQETQPGTVFEIVERDDGFISVGDAARYFVSDPEAWNTAERWACDRIRGRVLDVGCGAGRHALYFQERGANVTAMDISQGAIEVCRRRGMRQLIQGDIHAVARMHDDASFDTVVMLGNNLGLLGSLNEARRVLAAVSAISSPDARIIGTVIDPYETSEPEHLAYHEWNRSRGRMGGQNRLRIRYRKLACDWFDYLFASKNEMASMLESTGWYIDDYFKDGQNQAFVFART